MSKTYSIEITDTDDCRILDAMSIGDRQKALHRGVNDLLYRRKRNAEHGATLKAFTKLKKAAGLKGLSIEEMVRLAGAE